MIHFLNFLDQARLKPKLWRQAPCWVISELGYFWWKKFLAWQFPLNMNS
jgi:hypothetical protein